MLRTLIFLLFLVSTGAHGELLWEYSTDGIITGNPVIHDDRVYVTGGNSLHAVNRQGEKQWSYDTGADSRSTVTIADGVIYVLADNGLHAVDMKGQRLWLFETADGPLEVAGQTMGWGEGNHVDPWAWYRSAPLVVGDTVVFANRQGTYALQAKTGKLSWHTNTGTTHTRPRPWKPPGTGPAQGRQRPGYCCPIRRGQAWDSAGSAAGNWNREHGSA